MGSTAESNLVSTDHPISISTAPQSFEKWLRINVITLGGSTIVDNIRLWLSSLGGGYKAGEIIMSNLVIADYVQATYPINGPVNTKSAIAIVPMPTSEPVQANVGIAGQLAGQIIVDASYSDWIVLQLQVSGDTPTGAVGQKTITIEWDEQ
jgi:hypothetical protein